MRKFKIGDRVKIEFGMLTSRVVKEYLSGMSCLPQAAGQITGRVVGEMGASSLTVHFDLFDQGADIVPDLYFSSDQLSPIIARTVVVI